MEIRWKIIGKILINNLLIEHHNGNGVIYEEEKTLSQLAITNKMQNLIKILANSFEHKYRWDEI